MKHFDNIRQKKWDKFEANLALNVIKPIIILYILIKAIYYMV
jgi:hypothetical protein